MKVYFYIDLDESLWDHNLKCSEGRDNHSLLASTNQTNKMQGAKRIKIEVDLPNKYFTPPKVYEYVEAKVL